MTIGIHQPNFFPHQGFFEKMSKSDVFVLLDNVQYEKDSFTNRTWIKTPKGKQWLTFAIKNKFPQMIKDVEFADFDRDRKKHLKAIEYNYKKAKNFDRFPLIEKLYEGDWDKLSGFNIRIIRDIAKGLKIQPKIEVASQYNFKGQSTELLIDICKQFEADTYLSGIGGRNYQDEESFKKAGIKVEYHEANNSEYPQLWGDFVPGLFILDFILN